MRWGLLLGDLLPSDAVGGVGDGGEPDLAGDELYGLAGGVGGEGDLILDGGARPSGLCDFAVLENDGVAGAGGFDVFAARLGGGVALLDDHGYDDGGGELGLVAIFDLGLF